MNPILTSISILSLASICAAHVHFDISPVREGNKIRIDGLSHGSFENPWTAEVTPSQFRYLQSNQHVFEYEFGEDPLLPFYAADPGISRDAAAAIPESATYNPVSDTYDQTVNASSTGLRPTTGDRIRVQIIDDLKYWNGSTFTAVPDGETLSISLSGSTRVAGTGTGVLSDFPISWTGADSLHLHAGATLEGNGGIDADPTAGAYLLTVQLNSTITGVTSSDPIYIVYGNATDEATHEAAIAYAELLVPEPASLGLLSVGGLFLRRRR